MKKLYKLLGVIAIGAVIAIGLAGCDNGTTSTAGGGGSKIPAELIDKWKVEGQSDDNYSFEFTADKLIMPRYSGECEFLISGKHIKAGAKGTPTDYLSDFCTDYTIGSDGKLTLTGSQIFGNPTFVKTTKSTDPPDDNTNPPDDNTSLPVGIWLATGNTLIINSGNTFIFNTIVSGTYTYNASTQTATFQATVAGVPYTYPGAAVLSNNDNALTLSGFDSDSDLNGIYTRTGGGGGGGLLAQLSPSGTSLNQRWENNADTSNKLRFQNFLEYGFYAAGVEPNDSVSYFSGNATESGSTITITKVLGDYNPADDKISFTATLSNGTLTVSNWSDASTKATWEGTYTRGEVTGIMEIE
jgi:hypothetical protein